MWTFGMRILGQRLFCQTRGNRGDCNITAFSRFHPFDLLFFIHVCNRALMKIYSIGRECYEIDKRTYHVSAELERLPSTDNLPSLLNDFHAREMLHVQFGSTLAQFGRELRGALVRYETAYLEGLRAHFEKPLRLLQPPA